jgi:hypothetical protein
MKEQLLAAAGEARAPTRGLLVAREGRRKSGERKGEEGASDHGCAARESPAACQASVFK